MEIVHVNASKKYDIKIEKGLLSVAAKEIKSVCSNAKKIAIISDDKVYPLYGETLKKDLEDNICKTISFVFANGEQSKSAENFIDILNFLGENEVTRSDVIIALGGGVVGDIAGFVAASFLRGIRFIQIPTTLLAMVDSSVGGKTAINLISGKNLAGAFYQPELVLCDTNVLSTLSERDFANGCAEIIKYGMICDKTLFDFVKNKDIASDIEYVIRTCVQIKADIVCRDEFDNGERQLLNFGHTIGHAIEKCSNYTINHGHAVCLGMIIMSKGAYKCSLCKNDFSKEIAEIAEKYHLPVTTQFSAEELYNITLCDKKRMGTYTNIVIPEAEGKCILKKIPSEYIFQIIKEGLQ